MDVVGHDDEMVDVDAGVEQRDFVPDRLYHASSMVRDQGVIYDVAKQARPVLRDDGDEVLARFGVVVTSQPDRPAVAPLRVVTH
jgi:hypothetical protein